MNYFNVLVVLAASVGVLGCRSGRIFERPFLCCSEAFVTSEDWSVRAAEPGWLPVNSEGPSEIIAKPVFDGGTSKPVFQTRTIVQPGATYAGTVQADQIEHIAGTNAVRLRQAIETAIAKAHLPLRSDALRSVTDDRVLIVVGPIPAGPVIYTHSVLAEIKSSNNEIVLTISSSGEDARGQRALVRIPDDVPKEIFDRLQAALQAEEE